MTRTHRHRRDRNHRDIVIAFQSSGATVATLADVGDGIPDLLIGYKFFSVPVETKSIGGQLSEKQREWHQQWGGAAGVARQLSDVLNILRTMEAVTIVLDRAAAGQPAIDVARFAIAGLKSSYSFQTPKPVVMPDGQIVYSHP